MEIVACKAVLAQEFSWIVWARDKIIEWRGEVKECSSWIGLNDNKLFINMIGSADERPFTVFDRLKLPVSAARSQYLPQWKDHDTLREGELWSLKTNAQSTYKNLFQKLSRCGLDFSMCCYL